MNPETTEHPDVVAEVLAQAFTGDPFMNWVLPDPTRQPAGLLAFWGFLTKHRSEGTELWLASDDSCAAVWRPPVFDPETSDEESHDGQDGAGSEEPDGDDEISPFVEMMTGLVGDRLREVMDMFAQIGAAHPEEAHWYLSAVGTRPERQGQGSGAALLAPMLGRCDQQGLPAYLESSNPRNVAFYHRLGFVVTGELVTPDDSAVMTCMWRAPRS